MRKRRSTSRRRGGDGKAGDERGMVEDEFGCPLELKKRENCNMLGLGEKNLALETVTGE